ncbi:MAG: hypothetical protein BRD50_03400 [Bacteroidetes bacterium SW_11_45_7]|nr:MAG: hypothetical protein BRD50_03400 [Bacteroidetes bacterium SW_11_45_7]
MRKVVLIGLSCILLGHIGYATHNRAGEIVFKQISYLSYEATIVTYSKKSSVPADRDTLTINWGDGTTQKLARFNGPADNNGQPQGVALGNDIKLNKYRGTHTYSGIPPKGFYQVFMTDPNRIAGIINIASSVNVEFFLEDPLHIYNPANFGTNNSPVLLNAPIDFANKNDTFRHNPNAYDPDGDSLTFELVVPKRNPSMFVPNYQYPDEVMPGPDNNITIDRQTGEVVWGVPGKKGIYNIAILVKEYRDGIKMGTLLRDMQIIVEEEPNDPPRISPLKDTCVVAGSELSKEVTAWDPDVGQAVELTATGAPFKLDADSAQFPGDAAMDTATSTFSWQTTCEHIRKEPYQVVLKAEDDYTTIAGTSIPLTDLETWEITVIAPPPGLTNVEPSGDAIDVRWNQNYPCDEAEDFTGFSVWRRIGSNPFQPDSCERGLKGRGYTQVAGDLQNVSYTDQDVKQGQNYCYRIVADFAGISVTNNVTGNENNFNKTESIPSNEKCAELSRDVPVILHASVRQTDPASGRTYVSWRKPLTTADNLDTSQHPGPYSFKLLRGKGQDMTDTTQIFTTSSPYFGTLNDTTFIDTQIDTKGEPHSYQVAFYAEGDELIGRSEVASTIFLQIAPADNQLALQWDAQVPWLNEKYAVFRRNNSTGNYQPLDTVSESAYVDSGLTNEVEYCYYVESFGYYTGSQLPSPLLNLSQKNCAKPIDTIPPCAPVVDVANYCSEVKNERTNCELGTGELYNDLMWQKPNVVCGGDVVQYNVYFARPQKNYQQLTTVTNPKDTSYRHERRSSIAGCYKVTAVDSAGNESDVVLEECVDNCPCYLLPNSFTPNQDGANDLYTPFMPYRFIEKVDFRVYNQWGNLVFQTSDPDIKWDGTHLNTGKPVDEGTYYYKCDVFEKRLEGTVKRKKPLNGYIELIRGQ